MASTFCRILEIGGIFVVFSAAPAIQEFRVRPSNAGVPIESFDKVTCDIWSFLPFFKNAIKPASGKEMFSQRDSELADLLSPFLVGSTYECIFELYVGLLLGTQAWRCEKIAENRYKDAVGVFLRGVEKIGEIISDGKGAVILVPQLNDKAGFLKRLIREILPSISPQFFPDFKVDAWIHERAYQLRKVLDLERNRDEIIERADRELASITQIIQQERGRYAWLPDLVMASGNELVNAVKTALQTLGFCNIVDVDAERDAQGQPRREDLQI
jgi:hypothetical protein